MIGQQKSENRLVIAHDIHEKHFKYFINRSSVGV